MSQAATDETTVRLIYRSHSKIDPANLKGELGNILRVARKNNSEAGVTGALMYYDNWFAQALEGPQSAVEAVFAKIKADDRHNTIEVREHGAVPARVFARWAMANVGEHGDADTPLMPSGDSVVEGAPWKPTPDQESVLTALRDASRGYGRGA